MFGDSDSTDSTDHDLTIVYLDLDDTLIPTTIRNSIRIHFGFELFKLIPMFGDSLCSSDVK